MIFRCLLASLLCIGMGTVQAQNKKNDSRRKECMRLEQEIKTLDERARRGVVTHEMNQINEKRRKARSRWHELRC